MAPKASTREFVPDDRPGIFREILGIIFGIAALLLLLALISDSSGSHYAGQLGDNVADTLYTIFGKYVAYLLPVMVGFCSLNALRGELALTTHGVTIRRGIGGLLVIIAACALLWLSVSPLGGGHRNTAFERGGMIGFYLIEAEDLQIGRRLGQVGGIVVFSGLTLIGIVLFTEKFVRDLCGMGWQGVKWTAKLPAQTPLPKKVPMPGMGGVKKLGKLLAVPFVAPFAWLGSLNLLERIGGLFKRETSPAAPAPKSDRVFGRAREREMRKLQGRLGMEPDEEDERTLDIDIEDPVELPALDRRRQKDRVFPAAEGRRGKPAEPKPEPRFAIERLVPKDAEPEIEEEWEDEDELDEALDHPDDLLRLNPEPQMVARVETPAEKKKRGGREASVKPVGQDEMDLFPKEFTLPGLDLLADPPALQWEMSDGEKERLSRQIEQTLAQFKIEVQVIEVIQGPVITRFAMKVAPGVRVNRILALESELAMALKAQSVRILAPIPGQSAVGIEVPNKKANPVVLKDLITSDSFRNHKSPLGFALGKNIAGEPVICDLAAMPHLLIAGTTGSGKSVCLNTIIASMLYRNKPDKVKFVMIDPKRVELSIYQAIPHLIAPVVSETKKAAAALAWCVEQMEQRYKLLAEIGVRNLDSYNALLADKVPSKKIMGRGDLKFLPHIVIIIDELADLMMVAKNEVEEYIIRLAQMARAVGMHLILATQRPSVNVITGIIKANFPSRIAFQVSSKVDSRTILDLNGAEALMGRGDMLYSPGGAKPFRIQGCFVSDGEVERLADYIREQEKARYEKEDFEVKPTPAERAKAQLKTEEDGAGDEIEAAGERVQQYLDGLAVAGRAGTAPLTPADMELLSDEDLYDMALKLVLESRKASVSYIQRRMKIGYARAGRIMDLMEERGIVGPYQGSKPRDLRVDPEEYLAGYGQGGDEAEE